MSRGPRTAIVVALALGGFLLSGCSDEGGSTGPTGDAEQVLEAALAAHAEGRLDEAVDLYEEVLVLDPQNEFAYYNLGLIDQTRGRIDAAVERYLQALTIDPTFTPALFNLATIRAEQGATDEAIRLYREVLAQNPEDAGAHLNLGFLLLEAGEREKGEDELATAVELDPSLESRIPDGLVVMGESTGP